MLKGLLKKFLIITVMLVMLSFGFFKASSVKAQPLADPVAYAAILTSDQPGFWATLGQTAKDIANWATDVAINEWEWIRDEGIALAYKKALNYFLKTLAYDAATYLVTGDKGQGSMFYTESFGDYLANVGDNAAGHFLETLGAEGPVKFDLCHPGENMVQIGLGIMKTKRPDAPDCSYSEMRNNWETELNRPDFMSRFVKIYDVESNDFGVALSLQSDMIQSEEFAEKVAEFERTTNQGFKDVTDKISGAIKTPSDAVRSYMDDVIEKSGEGYLTYTGHALADAIDVFTNTLIGKLLEEWLKKGLSRSHDDTSYAGDWGASGSFGGSGGSGGSSGGGSGGGSGGSSGASYAGSGGLTNYEENTSASGGIVKAQKQFETLIAPSFAVKGDYEVLNDLVSCGKPTEADVDECVITDSFRQAVDKKLSVADAANQGFLSKSGTFGFKGDGVEPSYSEGFPYRSMLILRKYRIIPVGWELAAQYISENQNALKRSFNLGDMIACFDANDRYAGHYAKWCEGLVDPAWVLKAPLNFCKREGPGPYIQSKNVVGNNTDSRYVISRDTSYCADEQTCVKEKKDGSCEVYGYCVEDRRKYNFDGESCDPNYNTCQTFRAGDGRTLSLLENTLDYGDCDADNAGCEYYRLPSDVLNGYNASTDKVNYEVSTDKISLDASASACEAGSEGCHEFIRMKPGMGTNILTNSSFESEDFLADWGAGLGNRDTDSKEGFNALELTGEINRSVVINQPNATWPDFSLAGSVYTLSFYARACEAGAEIRLGVNDTNETTQEIPEGDEWRFIAVSHTFSETPAGAPNNTIRFRTTGGTNCVVDAFKLERSLPEADGVPTQYVPYRGVGIVYEKLLPDYLYDLCYTGPNPSGFIQKQASAPAICDDYARPCTATEVDCSLYSSQTEDFQVPAVVGATDYCPADCVGYDNYQQSVTNFEKQKEAHLIPSQAKQCTLMAKGCDAFTNLDETTGAEKREYFVNLRSCVAPTEPSCQTFFMWEGSDESGYQLKVHKLDTLVGGVIRTRTPGSSCSVDLADINDPNNPYHPDCREFYDLNGDPQYAVYYDTFSCTEDCHPYRRAVMSDDLVEEDDCVFGGGKWYDTEKYCVYMGVPQENITCSAEDAGCREYSGNAGANERVVFEHSFENGTNMGWVGGVPSTDSVIVGQHSMSIANEATLTLGGEVVRNRSYVLEFLATTNGGAATIDIDIVNPNPVDGEEGSYSFASDLSLTDRWQSYQVNLPSLGHTVDQIGEYLRIRGNIYIDNIRLIEVIDRHYLIKDSWDNKCDFIDLNPTNIDATNDKPGYYAGCDAYLDADKKTHNLFQFNHLCSEDAVGCEMMIDTHNSTDYAQAIHYDTNSNGICDPTESDCELVPHDSFTFAVFDKTKSCALQEKGCERLGLRYEYSYGNTLAYQYFDNYRLNDPDKYAQSLCRTSEARCDAWASRNGQSYFKDPNDMICEWRLTSEGGIGNWDWYKKKVKRCDANDNESIDTVAINPASPISSSNSWPAVTERNLCQTAAECGAIPNSSVCEDDDDCAQNATCVNGTCHHSCILDENDYACQTDNTANIPPKTAGTGGQGGAVRQPLVPTPPATGVYWAGACPGNQDDCTEYIDPISSSSPQIDTLEPNTLYVLTKGALPTGIAYPEARYFRLNDSNRFELDITPNTPGLYYYFDTAPNNSNYSFNPASTLARKAIVDYQLDYTLNKSACNGMVDLDKGCQLFNERKKDGADYSSFTYLANRAIYMNGPISPQSGTGNDSNLILKVTPDRDCNKWLSCRSFIKDSEGNDVCFDVGLCDRFDANGNCSSFISKDPTPVNQVFNNIITTNPPTTVNQSDISNRTGYSLLSYGAYSGKTIRSDYFPVSDMKQVGQTAIIGNAGFEMFGADLYPIGWMSGDNNSNSGWTRDKFKVINDPVTAQKENITYPMDGVSFLKFGAVSTVFSEPFEIVGGQDYILTYWINTKNLASGDARVSVVPGGPNNQFLTSRGENWRKEVHRVNIGGGLQSARIRLETIGDGRAGNVYIDNISLKPALFSRTEASPSGNNWYTTQDCRLFPENSSLGCDYYGEGSHRKTGWYGYCLQYDRYPGDPKACLQWYPIDRVNGDGFEEGGGYIDRDPLYYCTATSELRYGQNGANITPLVPTQTPTDVEEFVRQNNFGAQQSGDIDITINRSSSDDGDNWTLEQLGLGEVDAKWLEWENIDHIRVRHSSPSVMCCDQISPAWDNYYRFTQASQGTDCSQGDFDCIPWGIYPNYQNSQADSDFFGDHCHDDAPIPREGGIRMLTENGKFVGIKTSTSDTRCDHPDMQLLEVVIFPKIDFCSEVVQAVTPTGYNKYYSNHVYEGSNYQFNCNGGIEAAEDSVCVYSSDLAPFGAVAQPGLANNDQALQAHPYMWDSKEGTKDNQPLFYELKSSSMFSTGQARMGQYVSRGSVTGGLFAQYFGRWVWRSDTSAPLGVRQITGNYRYEEGPNAVSGGGIDPRITRISNNGTGMANVNVNSLMKLTFNTDIDPAHLPMTMLSVNWGDGSFTTISGMEMRDRPEASNPHVMYHIYEAPRSATISITVRDNWGRSNTVSSDSFDVESVW